MRKLAFFVVVLSVFLFADYAAAQSPTPNPVAQTTFMPSPPAFDKPFIWLVTTPALVEPARVSWQVTGGGSGNFNKIADTKWFCFFSSDQTSTCGPTPFTSAGGGTSRNYLVTIKSGQLNNNGEAGVVQISQLPALAAAVYKADLNLGYMEGSGFTDTSATVKYKVLSAIDPSVEIRAGPANYSAGPGRFEADFKTNPLAAGKYFLLFELTKNDGKKGGSVGYFEVAAAPTQTPTPTAKSSPIEADPVSISAKANQTENLEFPSRIRNPTNDSVTNLTAALPSSLTSFMQVLIVNDSIAAGDFVDYKIKIPDVQSSLTLSGKFNITGISNGTTVVAEVPFNIKVDVIIPQVGNVESERPILDASPAFFSETLLANKKFIDRITVKNKGKGGLGSFSIEFKGISRDLIKAELPSEDIPEGGQGFIEIEVTPPAEQKYTGSILIKSNGGEREIGVSFEAFEDISSDIDSLGLKVSSIIANITGKGYTETEAKDIFIDVTADLATAKAEWDSKRYKEAKAAYRLAEGKLQSIENLLASRKPSEGLGILLPVIIIVAVLAVAFVAFRKFKGKKPEEGYAEDEYEEEEEYTEPEEGEEQQ